MSDLTTRLRSLGIEPGEAACDYELRAQESNLIPRLSCDAALDKLVTALEEMSIRCKGETAAKDRAEKRLTRAERKYDGLVQMMVNAKGQVGWEVFEAPDGQPAIREVQWKERAQRAERALYKAQMTSQKANDRAEQAEAEIERLHHDGQTRVSRELHEAALAEQVEAREQAEAERDAFAVRLVAWADVGMDGLQKRAEAAEDKLTRSETAFGILSDLHPGDAKEAWRKAGELCGGAG